MTKLYVLVRDDLSRSQQAVQSGHALAQYLIEHPDTTWTNGTLVYLKTDFNDLIYRYGSTKGCSVFREPDIGGEITAIAVTGRPGLFEGLQLL